MTLEDFFTLTETKDGLTSSDRVNELMNFMIREKDHAIKNWSTVASTIAATKDKVCLNLFVKLDGISFINKWLEDAQNLDNEESTISLLKAVEKLSISYELSVAYGTREIVEKLFGHSSVVVQEKAKLVFGSWKEMDDGEAIKGLGSESGQTVSCEGDIDPSVGIIHEEKHGKIDGDKVDYIETRMDNEEKDLDDENMKDKGILLKKPFEENLCSEAEDTPCQIEGKPSDSTSTGAVPKEDGIVSNQFSGNEEQMQEVASPIEKLRATEVSPSPMENDSEPVIGTDLETDSVRKIDSKESATYDMIADMPLSSKDDNNAMNVDATPPNHSEPMDEVSQKLSGDDATNVLDSSGNQDRSPKIESPDTSSLRGDSDSTNSEHSTSESEGVANDSDFLKNKTKDNIVANRNMSDFDLSYGMVDALEVARQVAIEVEREVEGRRETSYSSSSQKDQNDQSSPVNETQTGKNDENDPKVSSSQLSDEVQMAESKPEKGIIHFDLNDDICCSDDTDQPLDTTSTHVSIVSASRAAAALGFPVTPLQFDGAHGWKGSAATSAFRPASPRKNDTFDNDIKRNQNFLDFDLNMCENEDEKAAHFDLNRISDEHDEGDASLSRFSERILLRNSHHNASPSSSSSSMRNFDLNNQPSFLNDSSELNLFANSSSSQNVGSRSNRNVISIMGTKVEVDRKNTFSQQPLLPTNGRVFDPALDVNLTRNGGILGIPYQVQVPGMFTYNGRTNGPTGPIMYGPGGPIPYMVPQHMGSVSASPSPFTGIYGMHHLGFNGPGPSTGFNVPGPSTGFNGPGPSTGFNGHGPSTGFNGHGPSRPNFDLNLGLNRESGVLRQFLGPGQNFQPSTSAGIGKRNKPDGGWEGYPFEYKHHQWK